MSTPQKLEALAEKATKGPWEVEDNLHTPLIGADAADGTEWIICDLGLPCDLVGLNPENLSQRILDERAANAALIVELVNNLPEILAALRMAGEVETIKRERDAAVGENNRLRVEKQRLERACIKAAAPDFMTAAEKEALHDFVQFLRSSEASQTCEPVSKSPKERFR